MVATFIHLKWKQSRWFFYINSTVFALFLILYSLYISHLFSRPEKFCQSNQVSFDSTEIRFKRVLHLFFFRVPQTLPSQAVVTAARAKKKKWQ